MRHFAEHLSLHPMQSIFKLYYFSFGHSGDEVCPQQRGGQSVPEVVDLTPHFLQTGELRVAVVPGVLDEFIGPRPAQGDKVLPDEFSAELLELLQTGATRSELVEGVLVAHQSL